MGASDIALIRPKDQEWHTDFEKPHLIYKQT